MRIYLLALSCLFLFVVAANAQETLTNKTINDLQKVGLGKEVIKAKIDASPCTFDLSTDALVSLKKAGVSDEVIAAMMAKGTAPTTPTLSSGVYYFNADTKTHEELEPSVVTNSKSGGLGEAMKRSISGLFNAKARATLSGAEAAIKISTATPTFTFVFDTNTAHGLGDKGVYNTGAQSPNEFVLVKLKQVKNTREVVTGIENSVSSSVGIDDKLKVPFVSKKIKPGYYEVSFAKPLSAGEYCFMAASSSVAQVMNSKVYDFEVK